MKGGWQEKLWTWLRAEGNWPKAEHWVMLWPVVVMTVFLLVVMVWGGCVSPCRH